MYLLGDGIEKDPEKGLYWLKLLAENGDTQGQVRLGWMYYQGSGLEVDREAAF